MMRGLRMHGVGVRALAARQHFALPGDPPADVDVEVIDVPPELPGWGSRLAHLRRPLGGLGLGEFAERVREEAKAADVLHLEEVHVAWCSEGVATPSVVHLHYLVRRDRPLGVPWRREFRQVLEFGFAERAAMRRHRWLIASSPIVAAELRARSPHAQVQLVPLCLDPADYSTAPLDGPPLAGIIGTAAWPTTAAAIRRLVEEIWPTVHRHVPEARLLVAGLGTESLGLAGAGVEVLGQVPSAAEFLQGLSLLLYPITRGSGVKVKVLESIAVGLPVVTTRLGAEGIEAGDGVIVEESAEALVAAAVSILRDQEERRQRGVAARAAFEARYSPLPATEPLADLYRRLAETQ
jgi:glycosyltransferase involved in cell wall biosynthesis